MIETIDKSVGFVAMVFTLLTIAALLWLSWNWYKEKRKKYDK